MTITKSLTYSKKAGWTLYGFILLLTALGALAKLPATVFLEGLTSRPEVWTQVAILLLGQDLLIMGVLPAGIGPLVIQRIGIRLPIFEKLLPERESDARVGSKLLNAVAVAAVLSLVGLAIQLITRPMIINDLQAVGIDPTLFVQNTNPAPWWAMSLLAVSAGIVEEVAFRLGLLSLLAWLGSLIWKPREGRLRGGVFWTANIVIALAFSLAHFSNIAAAGLPLGVGLILRTLVGNSLASLVFGWIYWKRGLASAMLTHTFLDFFTYVLIPPIMALVI